MTADKTFLNGVFLKKMEGVSKEGEPYEFFKMNIKKDILAKQLATFETDEEGFVHFKVNQQKGDPSKYSITLDTWKPTKSTKTPVETGKSDDLPF